MIRSICRLLFILFTWLPVLSMAHDHEGTADSKGIIFTPASTTEEFIEVLNECVDKNDVKNVFLQSGLGDDRFPIATLGNNQAEVKVFYSQGIILQYGFNFASAIAAFYKASSLDSDAAMPYWGIALSANSNINSNATHGCSRLSYRAIGDALLKAEARKVNFDAINKYGVTQLNREVAYAKAFKTLFTDNVNGTVSTTDKNKQAYVDAMKELSESDKNDLDAATLYADALLNMTPWKWWTNHTGNHATPTPDVVKALGIIEYVLAKNDQYVGANHLYIHAIEESTQSESGIPMANRLPRLTPASGHLVHMASHIYQRIGDNAGSSAMNYAAVSVDRAYANQHQVQDDYLLHYLGHNIHFLTWTLAIEGRHNESLNMARELVNNTITYANSLYLCEHFPEEVRTKVDYFFTVPFYFSVRFQDWKFLNAMHKEVEEGRRKVNDTCKQLNTEKNPNAWKPLETSYTDVMYAYADNYRKISSSANSDAKSALINFWDATDQYWKATKNNVQQPPTYGNNDAWNLIRISNIILINKALENNNIKLSTIKEYLNSIKDDSGKIKFYAEQLLKDLNISTDINNDVIIALWKNGIIIQNHLYYNEPRDWYYTLGESLGYAYLTQGKYAEAQNAFTADLKENLLGGRSLCGKVLAMEKLGEPYYQVDKFKKEFATAWRNATIPATPGKTTGNMMEPCSNPQ
ncbi:hypothetical protein ACVBEF_02810 [Glaciimonas sp. GG7]